MTEQALRTLLEARGFRTFRARQILDSVYRRYELDATKISGLPKDLRASIDDIVSLRQFERVALENSKRERTCKSAFSFNANEPPVETVLIENKERRPTFCVSSQLGCGYGCTFCSTATMGLVRNLSAGEIVYQVWALRRDLVKAKEEISHNVVFMGMGEPLSNRLALGTALEILHARWGLGISWRRMTISSVGVIEGIHWLGREFPQVNLAVSLNAPNDSIRKKLMPSAADGGVNELIRSLRGHFETTGRRPTVEYVLISGLNDSTKHATLLSSKLRTLPCLVNLIPFNPNKTSRFRRPSLEAQQNFLQHLRREGLNVTLRRSPGEGISAACGQLASRCIGDEKGHEHTRGKR